MRLRRIIICKRDADFFESDKESIPG